MDHEPETAGEPQPISTCPSNMDCDSMTTANDDSSRSSQTVTDAAPDIVKSVEDMDSIPHKGSTEDRQLSSSTPPIDRLQIRDKNEVDVQMIDQLADQEALGTDKSTDLHNDLGSRQSTIPDDADIIDLTADEADDNQTMRQAPRHNVSQDRPIKLEPEDNDDHSTLEDTSVTHAHPLPTVGDTEIPDLHDDVFSEMPGDPANEMTTESMARMLQEFNENNTDRQAIPQEVDSDNEDISARKEFEKKKNNFLRRQRAGRVTATDEIDFKREAMKEESRLRARQARKDHERDDAMQEVRGSDLFVDQGSRSPSPQVCDDPTSDQPENEVQETNVTTTKKPRRGRTPKAPKSSPKGVSKKRSSTSTTTGKRRNKKKDDPSDNIYSILRHDVIAAAKANRGLPEQPGFSSKVKKNALQELIASLPEDERSLHVGDKVELENALKVFNGRGSMKADGNGLWRLKGMKTSIRHYQVLGAAWMRKREIDSSKPQGGILGDEMGLGKTVLAITNMVDGRPASDKRGARATLIIVPASLLSQWMSELERHIEPHVFRNVTTYRMKHKVLDPVNYLAAHDIVVTTYSEVARSLPANDPPPSLCTPKAKEEWWEAEVAAKKGPLHTIYWHRIILDEAQAIKNHLSKTSQAVCLLKAKHKWCLSGTPIQNSLDEFYPYFRFLNCPNTGSFELFKRNFTKNGSDKAIQRLQVILTKIMLRRTHETRIFDRPILAMPDIDQDVVRVRFNIVERATYNIIKERFFKRAKALASNSTGENNYRQIFVLILRLRQLTAHPLLIQKTLEDLVEIEDIERLSSLIKARDNTLDEGVVETAEALETALTISKNKRTNRVPAIDEKQRATYKEYMKSFGAGGKWDKINERSLCNACGSPATHPHITACLHLYCLACLNDLCYADLGHGRESGTCFTCGVAIDAKSAVPFNAPGVLGGRQSPDEDIDWYNIPGPILRSAKVKAAVQKIKQWFEKDPTSKIIVFTQFRGVIKIMERICREEKDWGYAVYHGEMSFEARDQEIELFSNTDSCRILLAAMKAGGVGLNLQAANRVMIMDLWWNESVESQAFTRCFRYGQKRNVEVAKIIVEDSIDTRIVEMQERKKHEIAQAMDEHRRPKNLTTQELLDLFADSTVREKGGQGDGDDDEVDRDNTSADEPFIFPNDPHFRDGDDSDVEIVDGH